VRLKLAILAALAIGNCGILRADIYDISGAFVPTVSDVSNMVALLVTNNGVGLNVNLTAYQLAVSGGCSVGQPCSIHQTIDVGTVSAMYVALMGWYGGGPSGSDIVEQSGSLYATVQSNPDVFVVTDGNIPSWHFDGAFFDQTFSSAGEALNNASFQNNAQNFTGTTFENYFSSYLLNYGRGYTAPGYYTSAAALGTFVETNYNLFISIPLNGGGPALGNAWDFSAGTNNGATQLQADLVSDTPEPTAWPVLICGFLVMIAAARARPGLGTIE
jgi:hypothetical protein